MLKSFDAKTAVEDIICWLENYKYQTKCKGVVLGISGGKDSTVVAMLAKKVWGDNVIGILMPNREQADLQDSLDIVHALNLKYKTVNIGNAYSEIIDGIIRGYMVSGYDADNFPNAWDSITVSEKAKTNIAPRLRMLTLYAVAQSFGYQVIGTGNATERYLGWFTKWGDGACDLNPIGHLKCSDVIEIGKLLAKDFDLPLKYIVKIPSDGLTGKSDEDNFGFTYEEAEKVMDGKESGVSKDHLLKITEMHISSDHKRKAVPIIQMYTLS